MAYAYGNSIMPIRGPLQARPLVVLWGAVQHEVPHGARIEDVELVGTWRLVRWLSRLSGDPIDVGAAKDLIARIEKFRAPVWGTKTPS
jgi:hypothetical protein